MTCNERGKVFLAATVLFFCRRKMCFWDSSTYNKLGETSPAAATAFVFGEKGVADI